jgi:hypothetical protein
MNKLTVSYFINIALIILVLIIVITGLTRFPEFLGIFGINYAALASFLPIYQMRLIHDWSGVLFVILVILHLAINCRWVVSMTRKMFGGRK